MPLVASCLASSTSAFVATWGKVDSIVVSIFATLFLGGEVQEGGFNRGGDPCHVHLDIGHIRLHVGDIRFRVMDIGFDTLERVRNF